MELILRVDGATPAQIAEGIAAAKAVFDASGVAPQTAAEGFFALQAWDDASFPEDGEDALTDDDSRLADIWLDAERAALRACAVDGMVPEGELELLLTDNDRQGYL